MIRTLAAALALFATSAAAQMPAASDPRLRTVPYTPDRVVPLPVAAGYQLMVGFAPDEQVDTIAIGDAAGWKVDANKRGDFLFVKLASGAQATNMTVVTNARVYHFMLVPVLDNLDNAAFAVRFIYSGDDGAAVARRRVRYRFDLSGPVPLRPATIVEDGERTILRWPDKAALPAMYRVDDEGIETLANSSIEGANVVIDGVPAKLIFRLDRRTATAVRKVDRGSR